MPQFQRRFDVEIPAEVTVALDQALVFLRFLRVLGKAYEMNDYATCAPFSNTPMSLRGTRAQIPGYNAGWKVRARYYGSVKLFVDIGWSSVAAPYAYRMQIEWEATGPLPICVLSLDEGDILAIKGSDEGKRRTVLGKVRRVSKLESVAPK